MAYKYVMLQTFLFFLLFFGSFHLAFANFDNCKEHFLHNVPVIRQENSHEYELCNRNYAVIYNGYNRIPRVAFAKITPEAISKARLLSRKGIEFQDDKRLNPTDRSYSSDYLGSNYDRGHLIGNAFFGDKESQKESFLMSNISPQVPALNREVFAKIEADTRRYIRKTRHTVYMVVGTSTEVSNCQIKVSGRVCVIDILWFAITDPQAKKSWAHWLHNAGGAQITAPLTIKELENRLQQPIFFHPDVKLIANAPQAPVESHRKDFEMVPCHHFPPHASPNNLPTHD